MEVVGIVACAACNMECCTPATLASISSPDISSSTTLEKDSQSAFLKLNLGGGGGETKSRE